MSNVFFNLIILDVSTPLKKFYQKEGSNMRFAKLFDDLVELFPESKFQRLKGFLLGKIFTMLFTEYIHVTAKK
jgi:hypothetical protein